MNDRLLRDLARGCDAIFALTRVCGECGMTVSSDPTKHFHDTDGHRRAEESRLRDDLQREAGDGQKWEKK